MITTIYNKKTKEPTLIELFKATRDVRCVQHGWHGTHRCDIQVVATHASAGDFDNLACKNLFPVNIVKFFFFNTKTLVEKICYSISFLF
jgi:hypothetical protein